MRKLTIAVVFAGFLVTAYFAAFAFWMCAYPYPPKVTVSWQTRFYFLSALSLSLLALGVGLVLRRRHRDVK